MAKRVSWYDRGHSEAMEGICDPPWQKGHRDHTSYMEGQADGERQMQRDAHAADHPEEVED